MIVSRLVFATDESAAHERRGAEHGEEIGLRENSIDVLGVARAAHIQAGGPCVERHVVERLILCAPVDKIGGGERSLRHFCFRLPKLYEAIRLVERKGTEKHSVDSAEYRRIGAD